TRRSDGSGKRPLRECRSLCGASFLDARIQTGVEHAVVCGLTRGGLVRACDRAARQQSIDSPTLALHRPEAPEISRSSGFCLTPVGLDSMAERSLQEQYAPENSCWGCGTANPDGLRIRSFAKNGEVVAEWQPQPKYEAFPGVLNGGIIGTPGNASYFGCGCHSATT